MSHDLTPIAPPSPFPSRQVSCTYYYFQRRCAVLQITPEDLRPLPTIGQVQRLARRRYHQLAKYYHPDNQVNIKHCHNLTGTTFRKITRTYTWLLSLDPSCTPPAAVPSPRYSTPPIYEAELPWAQCRKPLRLPSGFQEAMERYWY